MPKYRRHFPVSQSINRDPEVWELTETFGDWALRVWLQILSATDPTEGELRGGKEWIALSMSSLWGSNSRRYNTEWRRNRVLMMLEWMANKGWITIELDRIVVAKYWDYHKKRETNENQTESKRAPSEPSEPTRPKESQIAVGPRHKKDEPEWKQIADQIYSSDPKRFDRLLVLINWAAKEMYSEAIIRAGLEKLWSGVQAGPISNWWPYARKCLQKAYTEDQQAQSAKDKQASAKFIAGLVHAVGDK